MRTDVPALDAYRDELARGMPAEGELAGLLGRVTRDAAPRFPSAWIAGAPRWDSGALASVLAAWHAERLSGRGELERILGQTNDLDRASHLLSASLERSLRAVGVRRLAERVALVLASDARFVAVDSDGTRALAGGANELSRASLRSLVRVMRESSDAELGLLSHAGLVLTGSPILDDDDLGRFIAATLKAARGALAQRTITAVLLHRLRLPAHGDKTAWPAGTRPSVSEAVACLRRRAAADKPLPAADVADVAPDPAGAASILDTWPEGADPAPVDPVAPPLLAAPPLRRRQDTSPLRCRRGEVWMTAPGLDGSLDALHLLVLDDGVDDGIDVWHSAVVVDDDLDAATLYDLVLHWDESSLHIPQRVRLRDHVQLRRNELASRVGTLTTAGMETLTRARLGLLPDDRFGPDLTDPRFLHRPDPREQAAIARLDEIASAASGDEIDEDDDEVLAVLGSLEGSVAHHVAIGDHLAVVGDLVHPDAAPSVLYDADVAGESELAEHLRADAAAAEATQRLVLAEARCSARPHSPWCLDSALEAIHLLDLLPPATAATAGALADLVERRTRQAAELIAAIPESAVRAAPDGTAPEGTDPWDRILTSLEPVAEHLQGTEHGARLELWRRLVRGETLDRTSERTDLERSYMRLPDDEELPRAWHVGPSVLETGLCYDDAFLDVEVDGTTREIRFTLGLHPVVAGALRTARRDAESSRIAASARTVWAQAIDAAAGEVLSSTRLAFDGVRALTGQTDEVADAYVISTTTAPGLWFDPVDVVLDALCARRRHRETAGWHLRELSERFTAPQLQEPLGRAAEMVLLDSRSGTETPSSLLIEACLEALESSELDEADTDALRDLL